MPEQSVLQQYLDMLAQAAMTGDWQTYCDHVHLPFQLITETASLVITTENELRAGFDSFCEMLKSQRVTDYIRLADRVFRVSPNLISGGYVTHIFAGSYRILPPFQSQITLKLDGNRWRALSITNAMTNARWPIHVPRLATDDSRKEQTND